MINALNFMVHDT